MLSSNMLIRGNSIVMIRIKKSKGFLFDLALTNGIRILGLVALITDALF